MKARKFDNYYEVERLSICADVFIKGGNNGTPKLS